jgi:nucleotide-binding universal stress UspA family protein
MFEKILIGTDFSPASDCLIRCVGELKSLGLQHAILAHVLYVANTPGLEDRMEAEAVPELRRQKELLEKEGIEVTTELHLGIPARDLNDLAQRHNVDAIVIGSRGHGLWRSLFGGVAFKVPQIADRPVFIAPVRVVGEGENCQLSVCLKTLENILVPIDFSKNSEKLVACLENLLKTFKVSVTLLHVIDAQFAEINLSGREVEAYRKRAAGELDELKLKLQGAGALVETELVSGTPWKEIVDRTGGDAFSLVLMGSHGKGFFQEARLGSVANEVSRQTELPVLFVPFGS